MENQLSGTSETRASAKHAAEATRVQALSRFVMGEFQVDVSGLKLVLSRDQSLRKITFKSMRVLVELGQHAGATRSRDQLLDAVWPDTCPTPEVLTQAIKELRKALSDDQKAPEYIETIPKVGYRLLKNPEPMPAAQVTVSDPVNSMDAAFSKAANAPVHDVHSVAKADSRSKTMRWAWLLLATVFVLTIAWRFSGPQQQDLAPLSNPNETKFPVRMLTSAVGIEATPALSPNGEWLAYGAAGSSAAGAPERIWIRDLSTPNAQRLTRDDSANANEEFPKFSSDGLSVAFVRNDLSAKVSEAPCEIWVQRVLGGVPRKLLDCPIGATPPFDWPTPEVLLLPIKQRDSAIGIDSQSMGIFAFDLSTGSVKRIGSKAGELVHDWYPKRSPDGLKLAFRRGGNTDSTLIVADVNGQNAKPWAQLAHGARGFGWLPGSDGIVVSVRATAKYELAIIRPNQPMQFLGVAGQMPSVAQSGKVAFAVREERIGLLKHNLDSASPGELIFPSTQIDASPSFSPDGKTLAFLSDRGGSYQIWLGKQDESPQAITQVDAHFSNITWHPKLPLLLSAQLQPGESQSELLEYNLVRSQLKLLPAPSNLGLIVRVSYDVDPNFLLILSSLKGHRILQRFKAPSAGNSAWQLDWTLHDIGSFQRDHVSEKLYFTRVANNTLFSQIDGQTAAVVLEPFDPLWLWSWRVHDGRVYYSSQTEAGFALRQRTLSSGVDIQLRAMSYGDFALDLPGKIAVVPSSLAHEMDIGSVQLR